MPKCFVCGGELGNNSARCYTCEKQKNPEYGRIEIPGIHTPINDPIKPSYYRRVVKGIDIQIFDIINSWELGYYEGTAVTYIVRARLKNNGEDRLDDIRKAITDLKEVERLLVLEEEKKNAETGPRERDEASRC